MRRWLDRPGTAWLFGVVVPVAMVVLDPTVFRSRLPGIGLAILGVAKPLGYTGIGLGVMVMVVALRSTRLRAVVAGALAGATLFSIGLGLAILPLSLLGLFLAIGLLGLSPFVSAAVFGWRAAQAYNGTAPSRRLPQALIGFVLFLAIPLAVQHASSVAYDSAVADIVSGSPVRVAHGTEVLRHWKYLLDGDQLVDAWNAQRDSAAKAAIAAAYEHVFGGDLEARADQVVD